MPPAARLTDMHTCPMVTVLVPHVGGPIIAPCCPTVLIGGLPAARVTDMLVCVGPPDVIVKGSAGVFIGKLPAARIGDLTAHGGVIVVGLPTVIIGEVGSGPGGGGGIGMGGSVTGSGPGPGTPGDPADLVSTGAAMSAPGQQSQTLQNAAKDGTPFCERCAQGG
jgi:uncharacterized Zn-binding protein involved in type VI secretion